MNFKIYKLKNLSALSFYCEVVQTSLSIIIGNVVETLARNYGYKVSELDANDLDEYCNQRINEIKEMSDEELFSDALESSLIGVNIVLPTIPKIVLANIDDPDEVLENNECIDITEKVVKTIRDRIDIEEIKRYVSNHTDDEIAEKYCSNKKYIDMFWDI